MATGQQRRVALRVASRGFSAVHGRRHTEVPASLSHVLSRFGVSLSLHSTEWVVDHILPPIGPATGDICSRAGHVHVGSIGGLPFQGPVGNQQSDVATDDDAPNLQRDRQSNVEELLLGTSYRGFTGNYHSWLWNEDGIGFRESDHAVEILCVEPRRPVRVELRGVVNFHVSTSFAETEMTLR